MKKRGNSAGVSPRAMKHPGRWSKLLVFICNLLLVLPSIVGNVSLIGLSAAAAVLLAVFVEMIWKSEDSRPASADLPVLVFADFLLALVLRYRELLTCFAPGRVGELLQTPHLVPGILIAVGVAAWVLGMNRHMSWLNVVAGMAVGAGIISQTWGTYIGLSAYGLQDMLDMLASPPLAGYLLAALCWAFLSQAAVQVCPSRRPLCVWLGLIMVLAVAALYCFEIDFIAFYVLTPLSQALEVMSAGWGAFPICVLLFGCSAALYAGSGRVGVDAVVMMAGAVFLLSLNICMRQLFPGCFLLLPLLLVFLCRQIKQAAREPKSLRLNVFARLALSAAVFAVAARLFAQGLWANLLIGVLFAVILRKQLEHTRPEWQGYFPWLTVMAFFVLEALAWQWKMCFTPAGALVLAMIFVMAVFALFVLNYPDPAGVTAGKLPRLLLCGCVCLLCFAFTRGTV